MQMQLRATRNSFLSIQFEILSVHSFGPFYFFKLCIFFISNGENVLSSTYLYGSSQTNTSTISLIYRPFCTPFLCPRKFDHV